ncbi:patatin-like phospholipase family protein [Neptunitalea lumnitzerae]|uniref:PNPLA domain-containing protein n=1 Tax=Neptunitalea lumnitzerae TaxID=2965509 RepID=A0ABQ5MGB4_9FLAO|nr:patatin-like phospholipase family protein [Neptunitalea sp. Y10]GLB48454.1 hypothetical protein Y10_08220 [Neptunitalea sp. Y10]
MTHQNIGLVLSGGGVRALAHAGFIKALLEHQIKPTHLSGTSGGALIATLYATGYHPDEMLAFFKETPLFSFSLVALKKPGLIDSEKYDRLFRKFFHTDTFEALKIPTTIAVTNITSGKLEYFNKGELIKPLVASAALPPYFSPVEMNGELYADGGMLNNFPTEPLESCCDVTLGSFVNPVGRIEKQDINSTLKLLQRVYHISMDANYYEKFQKCQYVFMAPNIHKVGILDVKMLDKAFQIGYEHAQAEIGIIKKIIEGHQPKHL